MLRMAFAGLVALGLFSVPAGAGPAPQGTQAASNELSAQTRRPPPRDRALATLLVGARLTSFLRPNW